MTLMNFKLRFFCTWKDGAGLGLASARCRTVSAQSYLFGTGDRQFPSMRISATVSVSAATEPRRYETSFRGSSSAAAGAAVARTPIGLRLRA